MLNAHFVRIRVLRVEARFASADRTIKRGTLKNALRLSLSTTKRTASYPPFSHSSLPFARLSISQLPFFITPVSLLARQARRDAYLWSRTSRKCSNYGNYNVPSYTDGLKSFFSKDNISKRDWDGKLLNPAERNISKFYWNNIQTQTDWYKPI